ncbi:hypothetical protein NA57DRAFT_36731 [Rhizodiscina lignyota]|uniref:Peroxin 26 n=1 Tax=Rhizodiscina lignyota TaxID=1504668 RepID=A0A9P4M7I8_9PEZI|nr:hypothetical protein NA57DRAFT_36731 [Rhizodiscina lignyota]
MPTYTDPSEPASDGPLYSSISSLSSNPATQRQQASNIAKSYRQAAQLFLTRRLPEALSTIEPVIAPQQGNQDGTATGSDGSGQETESTAAPIASASRGTRIKVWSFYLTFLNAVVDLGPEEGKHAFGSTKWKALVAKARDGTVWEDVVRNGYNGIEGEVDPDVVVNLATLLLTHSPSQKLNQSRLETYLSATSTPTFSISSSQVSGPTLQRRSSNSSHHNGTSTPRDLNTRLKLLELYTLHILPRNQEWQYAREFIMMSEVLDDERKETFLHALHNLREESEQSEQREQELAREREEQLEAQRQREEEIRKQEEERDRERRRKEEEERKRPPSRRQNGATNARPAEVPGPTDHGRRLTSPPSRHRPNQPSRTPAKRSITASQGIYRRAAALVAAIQSAITGTAQSVSSNPMAFLRAFLFLLAFVLAFARAEVRERVKRWVMDAWDRIRRTIGMGVKVSYI